MQRHALVVVGRFIATENATNKNMFVSFGIKECHTCHACMHACRPSMLGKHACMPYTACMPCHASISGAPCMHACMHAKRCMACMPCMIAELACHA